MDIRQLIKKVEKIIGKTSTSRIIRCKNKVLCIYRKIHKSKIVSNLFFSLINFLLNI